MKINIKNLGRIKNANLELKDLTIICGPNSSNKTWLSYLIGNMLTTIYMPSASNELPKAFEVFAENIIQTGEASLAFEDAKTIYLEYLKTTIELSKDSLPKYFNTDKQALSELSFSLDVPSFSNKERFSCEWTSTFNVKFSVEKNRLIARNLNSVEDIDNPAEENITNRIFLSFIVYVSILTSEYATMRPHIISSERTGALMFQPEIDRFTVLIDEVMRSIGNLDINPSEKRTLIGDLIEKLYAKKSRLPTPVSINVQEVRDIAKTKTKESTISQKHPEVIEVLNQLNGGEFIIDDNELKFLHTESKQAFTIGSTSSSIKSIFLIDLIIRHKLNPNEIILIDEPELNLHPDNQRLMAKLLVRLVNAGVKILITTHSDFLIREINNAIALSNDFEGKFKFLTSNNLTQSDILESEKVSAYSVDKEGNVEPMVVGKFGIETTIFDNLINKANNFQDDILYEIEPSLFED